MPDSRGSQLPRRIFRRARSAIRSCYDSLKNWWRDIGWCEVRDFGKNRVIGSSFIWLFAVPIGAKILKPFVGNHRIRLPWFGDGEGAAFTVPFHLPFKWTLLYGMSAMFVVAQLVFYFRCPKWVKRFECYDDFKRSHVGPIKLNSTFQDAWRRAPLRLRRAFADRVLPRRPNVAQSSGLTDEELYLACCHVILVRLGEVVLSTNEDVLCRAFEDIQWLDNQNRRIAFCTSALAFCAGFFLLAVLIYQGATSVWGAWTG